MPSLQKTLLGGYVGSPHTVSIPNTSRNSKTVILTPTGLYLFQDSSHEHVEYLATVLPQLFLKNWTAEKYVKWFKGLSEGSFIEVDTRKKLSYICAIVP